ncbi:putative aldo-keto reductase [Annulohypoxylon truncatum]|uniref:putative aldo-keto reductase n=1 Tax=Annulohypoxylon truncatum TaxID=327061 RepID=UPI002007C98D|nr:putative aldo-keto reductase [Annulohypoxylon truncatum]KAI1211430.1 putative aldo-keto reductase [Annulohypoxylon truncatum]
MPAKPILHPLGKNGPLVPAMGLGLMGLSYPTYGTLTSDEERFQFLDRALEIGATFWDTADLYGNGEEFLGKWFKRTGKRDQIFLASKYGHIKGNPAFEADSSYEYTKKAAAKSLENLGVDCIDLYYIHSVNENVPIEETMRGLKELQDEGKIKHIGLSMVSSSTLRRAVAIAPVAAVQTEYSVFSQRIEGESGTHLLQACRDLGVAVVVATPLGRGLLTSSFTSAESAATTFDGADMRPKALPQFMDGNREANVAYVAKFRALADKKGCTVAQLALAWLLKQGDDIFPIPGTKRVKYLEENWGALDVRLSDEEEREIRAFARENEVKGGTVPPAFEHHLFKDTKPLS